MQKPFPRNQYRGRFAPSPTGPLHFGSLAAAVGSYLDAKHNHGTWFLRIEDLDTPRCVPGAADDILRTLEAFGLYWDDEAGWALPATKKTMPGGARPAVLHQSKRTAAYEETLHRLKEIGAVYACACTRKEIADSATHGIEGYVYPGTCRSGLSHPLSADRAPSWRVRTNSQPLEFFDGLQGHQAQNLEKEIGDFVVKRADGLFAYQLAVVVDDAFQGITHVVRGADLLLSTARQIHLQRLLGFPTPSYMHLPIAVNAQGEKLSKQTLAPSIGKGDAVATLLEVLEFLKQQPPGELRHGSIHEVLEWAVTNWKPESLKGYTQLPAPNQGTPPLARFRPD